LDHLRKNLECNNQVPHHLSSVSLLSVEKPIVRLSAGDGGAFGHRNILRGIVIEKPSSQFTYLTYLFLFYF
jgi:hypothetical protein